MPLQLKTVETTPRAHAHDRERATMPEKSPHPPPSATNRKISQPVSKASIDEYKNAFSFFDANNDGFITLDELEQAMNKCGQFPTKLELRLIMYQGDNDKNGVITFDEFTHLMDGNPSRNKYTYAQLREQFEMFDKDKDGFIERNEMLEIVRELALDHHFPKPVVEQLFRDADADGDGKISFEEFVLAVN